MSRPEGKTERERWPDDYAYDDWLSRSVVVWAAGGIGGLTLAPIWLSEIAASAPVALALPALLLALTSPLARRSGRPALIAGRLWRLAAWILIVVGLGIALAALLLALFPACAAGLVCVLDTETGRLNGLGLGLRVATLVAVFAVSTAGAVAADRLARRLVPPYVAPDPELDAWRERRGLPPKTRR